MKASLALSGDQWGDWLDFFELVSCFNAPVAASAIQICISYQLSSQLVSRMVYATIRPSGEISGDPARLSEST